MRPQTNGPWRKTGRDATPRVRQPRRHTPPVLYIDGKPVDFLDPDYEALTRLEESLSGRV